MKKVFTSGIQPCGFIRVPGNSEHTPPSHFQHPGKWPVCAFWKCYCHLFTLSTFGGHSLFFLTLMWKIPKLPHPPSLIATHQALCQSRVPNNIIRGEEKILYSLAGSLAWAGSGSSWLRYPAFQTQSVFKIPGQFQVQEGGLVLSSPNSVFSLFYSTQA